MKWWERNHLTNNLHKLLPTTVWDENLFALLKSGSGLSKTDLDCIIREKTPLERTRRLYSIVETQDNGFGLLARAFAECNQSTPFRILMEGLAQRILSQFIEQPTQEFFNTAKIKQLLDKIMVHLTPEQYLILHQNNKLYNLEEFKLVKDTIPSPPPHNYVPRSLFKRAIINPKLFSVDCPDVFVFKNVNRSQLTKLLDQQGIVLSMLSNPHLQHQRFIFLEEHVDWEEIKESSKSPAHLIQFEDHNITWVLEDTTGRSRVIHQYLDSVVRSEGDTTTEDKFMDQLAPCGKSAVCCIYGSAGMGKTLLLKNLARNLASRHTNRIVAFIKIQDLLTGKTGQGKSDGGESEQSLVQCAVVDYLSTSTSAKLILNELISAEMVHMELFLDGLEEIDSSQVHLAMTLVQDLLKSLTNTRIYITARKNVRYTVEATLGIISYKILPFTQQNKVDFMVNFWIRSKVSEDETKLSDLAGFCLAKFKVGHSNAEQEISVIPLQCQLLAQAYARRLKTYIIHSTDSSEKKFIRSIAELYQEYMELYFENCVTILDSSCDIHKIKHYHTWIALKQVLPNIAHKFARNFGADTSFIPFKLFSSGLLKREGMGGKDKVEFTHYSFAEFLVALFLASVLKGEELQGRWKKSFREEIRDFVFQKLLLIREIPELVSTGKHGWHVNGNYPETFQHSTLVYFLNFALRKQVPVEPQQPNNVLNEALLPSEIRETDRFYGLLIASLRHNYINIFSLLTNALLLSCQEQNNDNVVPSCFPKHLKKEAEPVSPDKALIRRIISVSVRFSSVLLVGKLFKFFLEYFEHDLGSDMDSYYGTELVKLVMRRENYDMITFLLDQTSVQDKIFFQACVEDTNEDSEHSVKRKLDICRLLLSRNPELFSQVKNWSILLRRAHVRLLKWMIKRGVDAGATHERETVVHHAARHMNQSDFHEFCRFLIGDCQAENLFQENEPTWKSPLLDILLVRKDTAVFTIQMILEDATAQEEEENKTRLGTIINANTLLLAAFATRQKNVEILDTLFNQSSTGGTKMFSQTIRRQPKRAKKRDYILDYLPLLDIDGSPLDDEGNNFLHVASKHYGRDEYHKIISFLVSGERTGMFTKKNNQNQVPMHVALENTEILEETVRLYHESGVDINSIDVNGSSFLMSAVRGRRCVNFLKVLIDMGVDVNLRYRNGETFAHLISRYYSIEEYHEIVQFLVDQGHGQVFELVDKKRRTPIQEAVANLELLPKTIDLLVANKCADLNVAIECGCSTLHCAVEGKRSLGLLKQLVNLGADWSVKNGVGWNLVHQSAFSGQMDHLKYFLELGVDINELDFGHNTALQCVVYGPPDNAMDVVLFLLASGVKKGNVNRVGDTAYRMAMKRGIYNKMFLDALHV